MALLRLFDPTTQFQTKSGALNVAGKLRIYIESTDDLANIYGDDGSLLSQPLILDSNGRARGLFVDSGRSYRLEAYDRNDSLLFTIRRLEPNASGTIINPELFIKGTPDEIDVEDSVTEGSRTYTVSLSAKVTGKIAENQEAIVKESEVRKGADDELRKMIDSSKAEAGTASPLMDGKASVGNSLKYAREDHVHPSDTSREDIANKTTVVLGTSDSKYPTDKAVAEFVNSSIATNTANYISNNGEPFTSVAQLEAYSGPVTNNDYAFVTGTDSEGNTYYDRYKATVSGETVTWALEYRLNNSSFTAAQWSAINSGITSALVAKIHTHSNKDVLDGITSTDVANWNSKMDKQTVGNASEPIYLENGIAKVCAGDFVHDDEITKMVQVSTAGTAVGSNLQPVYVDSSGVATAGMYSSWESLRGSNIWLDSLPVSFYRSSGSIPLTSGTTPQYVRFHGLEKMGMVDIWVNVFAPNSPMAIHFTMNFAANGPGSISIRDRTGYTQNNIEWLRLYTQLSGPSVRGLIMKIVNSDGTAMIWRSTGNITSSNYAVMTESEYTTFIAGYNVANPVFMPSCGGFMTDVRNMQRKSYEILDRGDVTSTYSPTGTDPVNGTAVAAAIGGLDVSSVGGDGKYISAISETDGKISATATTMDTTPTANSTKAVTSGGIKTALEVLQSNIDTVDAKGIVINEINGENVICFE